MEKHKLIHRNLLGVELRCALLGVLLHKVDRRVMRLLRYKVQDKLEDIVLKPTSLKITLDIP